MILAGSVLVGHVALDLWGTGLGTARAQSRFRAVLVGRGFPERPAEGEAIGFLRVPRLGLDVAFVEGVGSDDLALGPGHYTGTPLPGEPGNVAVAGHRTTHAAPFWALDTLAPGDHVGVATAAGAFLYRVAWTRVVDPGALWVVKDTSRPSLTLTTCEPRFSSGSRLVVRAVQVYGPTATGFLDRRARGFGLGGEVFGGSRTVASSATEQAEGLAPASG
jgi:sortase A